MDTCTLIERNTVTADYDLPCEQMIVDIVVWEWAVRRVFLSQGYHGGQYLWAHGYAVLLLPTDTMETVPDLAALNRLIRGGEDRHGRALWSWSGSLINRFALSAIGGEA